MSPRAKGRVCVAEGRERASSAALQRLQAVCNRNSSSTVHSQVRAMSGLMDRGHAGHRAGLPGLQDTHPVPNCIHKLHPLPLRMQVRGPVPPMDRTRSYPAAYSGLPSSSRAPGGHLNSCWLGEMARLS